MHRNILSRRSKLSKKRTIVYTNEAKDSAYIQFKQLAKKNMRLPFWQIEL